MEHKEMQVLKLGTGTSKIISQESYKLWETNVNFRVCGFLSRCTM